MYQIDWDRSELVFFNQLEASVGKARAKSFGDFLICSDVRLTCSSKVGGFFWFFSYFFYVVLFTWVRIDFTNLTGKDFISADVMFGII